MVIELSDATNQPMTDSAPTDRILVNDTYSLNEYSFSHIDVVIEQLTELRAQGYTHVDIEAQGDGYGGHELSFDVVRRRLENDEEYGRRVGMMETYRQLRYQEYLRMREEFGDTGPFEPVG